MDEANRTRAMIEIMPQEWDKNPIGIVHELRDLIRPLTDEPVMRSSGEAQIAMPSGPSCVRGSIPRHRSIVIDAAKAYRAAKTGLPVAQIGERYTADIGPMRAALAAIGVLGHEE